MRKYYFIFAFLILLAFGIAIACYFIFWSRDVIEESSLATFDIVELKVQLKHNGTVIGKSMITDNGKPFLAFLGIPFGKAPIGELRFKPPVPYGGWAGERLAQNYSDACLQWVQYTGSGMRGSEDCLYLNVYVPEGTRKDQPLPVLHIIFGGGFTEGSGQLIIPDYIMDYDSVLVTANYRTAALGFLNTETLDCPGNNGMKDQVLAMQWIQEYISAFGGDLNRVTISGNSAGAVSVAYHMASEKSRGLFHQAIIQSGGFNSLAWTITEDGVSAARAKELSELVGCETANKTWSDILDCLRATSGDKLQQTVFQMEGKVKTRTFFPPLFEMEHEDAFITKKFQRESSHHGISVPLMISFTTAEGTQLTSHWNFVLNEFMANFLDNVPYTFGFDNEDPDVVNELTHAIDDFYFPTRTTTNFSIPENHFNLTYAFGDCTFAHPMDVILRARLANSSAANTFFSIYDHRKITDTGERYLVKHADDHHALFTVNPEAGIRKTIFPLWFNFIYTGNPTPQNSEFPTWPPMKSYPPEYMRVGNHGDLNATTLVAVNTGEYPLDRMNFWTEQHKKLTKFYS